MDKKKTNIKSIFLFDKLCGRVFSQHSKGASTPTPKYVQSHTRIYTQKRFNHTSRIKDHFLHIHATMYILVSETTDCSQGFG